MPYKDKTSPVALESLRAARRKHYVANAEDYKVRARKRRVDLREWIQQLKSVPCMDCQQTYPWYVMDFDHRGEDEKLGDISRMISNGVAEEMLKTEIAKCDVVCANCHRARTWRRGIAQR